MWLWKDWPGRWGADAGIDLVAEDRYGHLWAIQAKAYDAAYRITKHDVDTFLAESGRPMFAFRLLIATTDLIGQTAKRTIEAQEKQAGVLLLGDLDAAEVDWPGSPSDLRARRLAPKQPRPHQRQAITRLDYSRPGKPDIDWGDPQAKAALVSDLVNDALAVLAELCAEDAPHREGPAADALGLLALVAG